MCELVRTRRIITFLLVMGLLVGCLWLMFDPCPSPPKTVSMLPEFIDSVFPQPGTEISLGCYYRKAIHVSLLPPVGEDEGGIIVRISTWSFLKKESLQVNKELPPFINRVFLFIDGRETSPKWIWSSGEISSINHDGDEIEIPLASRYTFGSTPLLLPGDHTVKVVIETLSGETLEYEWQFTITFP